MLFRSVTRVISSSEGFQTTGDTIGRDLVIGKSSLATVLGYAGSAAMVQGSNFSLNATPDLSLQPYGGNVGIGVTTISAKLQFDNSLTDNKINFYRSGSDAYGFGLRNGQLLIYSGAGGGATDGILLGKYDTSTFTEHMRINNNGHITTPKQPYAEATCSSGYNLGSNASRPVVIWDNAIQNIGSCLNTTNGRFTCPVTGVYLVTATVIVSSGSTSSDYRIAVHKNGSQVTNVITSKNTGFPSIVFSQHIYASASDYFDVRVWNDAGTGSTDCRRSRTVWRTPGHRIDLGSC